MDGAATDDATGRAAAAACESNGTPAAQVPMATALRKLPLCNVALRPFFILFGDSITQRGHAVGGWAARLADTYGRRADIINRGYSGYNTSKALQLLSLVFPKGSTPPALVTVFLGANDAALLQLHTSGHHVPVELYAAQLAAIVRGVREAYGSQAPPVLLIAPPPVDEPARVRANNERHGTPLDAPPERVNEVTGEYAAACRRVAAELGCPCLCTFSHFQAQHGWRETHLNDGLHFAPAGDEALHAALLELIARELPHLSPHRIPYDAPEWADWTAGEGGELSLKVMESSPYCETPAPAK
jgi:isoamyl acetate esterase